MGIREENHSKHKRGEGQRTYICVWCGQDSEGTDRMCPACGAPVDVRKVTNETGWYELPRIPDMAKLQFGASHCQIAGRYVPVADMRLAKGDKVYFSRHLMLWKDPKVEMRLLRMEGYSGLPMYLAEAAGPGNIAFSRDEPGELFALTLQPGKAVEVTEDGFMIATSNVQCEWFKTDVWFNSKVGLNTEVAYPMGIAITRLVAAEKPGLALLHGSGNVFVRVLNDEEGVLVKPGALLFKDAEVSVHLHFEEPEGNIVATPLFGSAVWNQRNIWLILIGPGRVAIQSAAEAVEDNGGVLIDSSTSSRIEW